MALTYAVLGSGAMGLRFGLLLKEHLGAQVDFIIRGKSKSTRLENKVVFINHVMVKSSSDSN